MDKSTSYLDIYVSVKSKFHKHVSCLHCCTQVFKVHFFFPNTMNVSVSMYCFIFKVKLKVNQVIRSPSERYVMSEKKKKSNNITEISLGVLFFPFDITEHSSSQ